MHVNIGLYFINLILNKYNYWSIQHLKLKAKLYKTIIKNYNRKRKFQARKIKFHNKILVLMIKAKHLGEKLDKTLNRENQHIR